MISATAWHKPRKTNYGLRPCQDRANINPGERHHSLARAKQQTYKEGPQLANGNGTAKFRLSTDDSVASYQAHTTNHTSQYTHCQLHDKHCALHTRPCQLRTTPDSTSLTLPTANLQVHITNYTRIISHHAPPHLSKHRMADICEFLTF